MKDTPNRAAGLWVLIIICGLPMLPLLAYPSIVIWGTTSAFYYHGNSTHKIFLTAVTAYPLIYLVAVTTSLIYTKMGKSELAVRVMLFMVLYLLIIILLGTAV